MSDTINQTQQPKLLLEGSHVLYVLPDGRNEGEIRPAIIVKVWRDVSPELIAQGYSNLVVFIDGTNDYPDADGHTIWATSKIHSLNKEPGTWHWFEDQFYSDAEVYPA